MQNILVQTNMKNIFIFDILEIFHIRKIAYEKDFQNFLNENCFRFLFENCVKQLLKKFLNYFWKSLPIRVWPSSQKYFAENRPISCLQDAQNRAYMAVWEP